MNILVACEESQVVTVELRKLGHEAYSCDIIPTSGNHPEWHIQQDVVPLLKKKWDMIIAFPPCTHLASSGARWFEQKRKDGRQQQAIDFFMQFVNADCPRIAIENPVGIMSTHYRKPDQIIQPWQFGHKRTKKTCLWLKSLSLLQSTKIVKPEYVIYKSKKNKSGYSRYDKLWGPQGPGENKKIDRSKTFPGIAKAMAVQWTKEKL